MDEDAEEKDSGSRLSNEAFRKMDAGAFLGSQDTAQQTWPHCVRDTCGRLANSGVGDLVVMTPTATGWVVPSSRYPSFCKTTWKTTFCEIPLECHP